MSLITGVGFSEHRNPSEAGRIAAEQALAHANLDTPDFVFLFGTIGYKQEPLVRAVRAATRGAPLSGCSAEGVIVPGAIHETNFGAVVCVVQSDEIRFQNAAARGMSTDAVAMGQKVGDALALHEADDALTLVSLADGLTLNFDAMLRGLMHRCPSMHSIPMIGGTASDNWTFTKTYQYCNDDVFSDGLVATLIRGKARLVTAARHGCVPVGEELVITKAEKNRIIEINGRRALDVIDEYLTVEERQGDWKKTNVYLAIGVRAPEHMKHYDDYLIRFMPMRDDTGGGVYVPTELAEGTRFFMTRRDHEKIASGNERLAEEVRTGLAGSDPRFLLQIECIGRGQVIFNDAEKQQLLRDVQRNVARDSKLWFGAYTYGEFSPVGNVNSFHNYSLIVTAIA
jgi:hypothetical protein